MNNQRGVIIAIIIILIIIGMGYWFVNSKNEDSAPASQQEADYSTTQSLVPAETVPQTITTPAPAPKPLSQVQNCGSVIDTHLSIDWNLRTASEKTALSCMDKAIAECSVATINFTGEATGYFKITGKENSNCLLNRTETGNSLNCKLPLSMISFFSSTLVSQKISDPGVMFASVALTASEGVSHPENTKTGEKWTVECRTP